MKRKTGQFATNITSKGVVIHNYRKIPHKLLVRTQRRCRVDLS